MAKMINMLDELYDWPDSTDTKESYRDGYTLAATKLVEKGPSIIVSLRAIVELQLARGVYGEFEEGVIAAIADFEGWIKK